MKSIAKLILLMLLVATLTETRIITVHDDDVKGLEEGNSKGAFYKPASAPVVIETSNTLTGQITTDSYRKGVFYKQASAPVVTETSNTLTGQITTDPYSKGIVGDFSKTTKPRYTQGTTQRITTFLPEYNEANYTDITVFDWNLYPNEVMTLEAIMINLSYQKAFSQMSELQLSIWANEFLSIELTYAEFEYIFHTPELINYLFDPAFRVTTLEYILRIDLAYTRNF